MFGSVARGCHLQLKLKQNKECGHSSCLIMPASFLTLVRTGTRRRIYGLSVDLKCSHPSYMLTYALTLGGFPWRMFSLIYKVDPGKMDVRMLDLNYFP